MSSPTEFSSSAGPARLPLTAAVRSMTVPRARQRQGGALLPPARATSARERQLMSSPTEFSSSAGPARLPSTAAPRSVTAPLTETKSRDPACTVRLSIPTEEIQQVRSA
jgi:hypothetical protein